eukprot:scaffold12953_cov96-Isochrysis_galbana.AAC.6
MAVVGVPPATPATCITCLDPAVTSRHYPRQAVLVSPHHPGQHAEQQRDNPVFTRSSRGGGSAGARGRCVLRCCRLRRAGKRVEFRRVMAAASVGRAGGAGGRIGQVARTWGARLWHGCKPVVLFYPLSLAVLPISVLPRAVVPRTQSASPFPMTYAPTHFPHAPLPSTPVLHSTRQAYPPHHCPQPIRAHPLRLLGQSGSKQKLYSHPARLSEERRQPHIRSFRTCRRR